MDNINQVQKKLLAAIRIADYDFGFFNRGDKVLIGLSGGKDSMVLATLLNRYRQFKGKAFSILALHLDFGFAPVDFKPVEKYLADQGIPYQTYAAHDVAKILNAHRNPANGLLPCSICSRMRKAIMNKAAHELGYSKVAFAHHMDDAIETLFLNMSYGARVATFEPKMFLEKAQIEFVRPLIYAREAMIERYAKLANIPVAKNTCGNDKHTQREAMKAFLKDFYKAHPDSYNNFAVMLTNADAFQLFFNRYGPHPDDDLFVKKVISANDMMGVAQIASLASVKDPESFDGTGAVYYLLRRKDRPIAYLKALRPLSEKDVTYSILSLTALPETSRADVLTLLSTVEKALSAEHVPTRLVFVGKKNTDVFKASGYQEDKGVLTKTLTRSLKI